MSAHVDLLAIAYDLVSQPPPPSLREILGAYRAQGDGDREMLLAMLNAKAAEEQSHANRTTLCRSLIDAQGAPIYPPSPLLHMHDHYPISPCASVHSSLPPSDSKAPSKRDEHHNRLRSHSPYYSESHQRQRTSSQSPPRRPLSPYIPVPSSTSRVLPSGRYDHSAEQTR